MSSSVCPAPAKDIEAMARLQYSEIIEYSKKIEELILLRADSNIPNSIPEHVSVLFEQFFRHANRKVLFFCKNLSSAVFNYSGIIDAAKEAFARGVTCEIIIQDNFPDNSEFANFVESESQKKQGDRCPVTLMRARSHGLKHLPQNFSVMDKRAYRIEGNSSELKATANLYRPQIAAVLASKFEAFKKYSQPLASNIGSFAN